MSDDEPAGPIGEIAAKRKAAILPAFMSESKAAILPASPSEPPAPYANSQAPADYRLAGTLIKGFGLTVVIVVGVLVALIIHDEYLKYQLREALNGKR